MTPTGSVHESNIVNCGSYAFYLSSKNDSTTIIDGSNNWWGVDHAAAIEALVYHHTDNSAFPILDYIPFATTPFLFNDTIFLGLPGTHEGTVPAGFTLMQNHPNPFNSGTLIEFTLPRPSHLELTVFDVLGRSVRDVASGRYPAGEHCFHFDGRDNQGVPLASGVYFYRLTAPGATQSRKMVLIK